MGWRALVAACLAGCTIPSVDLSGKDCPCGEGYFCDPVTDTCVAGEPPPDGGRADAGPDGPPDAGSDAAAPDAAVDAGALDAGSDAGPPDAGSDAGPITTTVIPWGSSWEYYDQPPAPPTAWRDGVGDWPSGPAELGYGDGDEATLLLDAEPNVLSVYFRRVVDLDAAPSQVHLEVRYDDGFTVWVGDRIVAQVNVTNTGHESSASDRVMNNAMVSLELPPDAFAAGENRIGVQVKQVAIDSSDLSFDLELEVTTP